MLWCWEIAVERLEAGVSSSVHLSSSLISRLGFVPQSISAQSQWLSILCSLRMQWRHAK